MLRRNALDSMCGTPNDVGDEGRETQRVPEGYYRVPPIYLEHPGRCILGPPYYMAGSKHACSPANTCRWQG